LKENYLLHASKVKERKKKKGRKREREEKKFQKQKLLFQIGNDKF